MRLSQVAPNRFVGEGSELALEGDWQVAAIVRTIGAFSWATDADVTIGATPPPPPVVNPAPVFRISGIAGMIMPAVGVAALAVALLSRGVPARRRGGVAGVGLVAVAAGFVILGSARIQVAAPGAVLAQAVPVPGSPLASPPGVAEHDHTLATPGTPAPEPVPGIGTPVSEGRLVVALDADARQPGPNDLAITVMGQSGAPVSEARVVIFSEMAGMDKDSQGVAGVEEEAGRFRIENVPLSMAGAWQLTLRISPRGQPTTIVRFVIEAP